MSEIFANVRKIIKFSAVDGPGNRSAIFLQGCNFNCSYCHNPETIDGSIKVHQMTAEDVFEELGTALHFIRGITVSGGECMLQRAFLTALFTLALEKNLSTFIDSNGSIDFSAHRQLLSLTHKVMLDIKSMDLEEHISITGAANDMVLKNLHFLAKEQKLYEIRTVCAEGLIDCEKTVGEAAKIIGFYGSIRYKLIRYRPNGVRKEFARYKRPNDQFMEHLKEIALNQGVSDIVII